MNHLILAVCFFSAACQRLIDYVDTRISTGGLGFGVGGQNPGPCYPFGSLRLGPDGSKEADYAEFDHFGGYHYNDTTIRAFSHCHLVGAGVADYGNIGIMPVVVVNDTIIKNHNSRSRFFHTSEVARPGYYSVYLEDPQVKAELTAAGTHAGLHRYTFDAQQSPNSSIILVDLCHSVMQDGSHVCALANVSIDLANAVISGAVLNHGSLSGRNGVGTWVYFYAQFEEAKPVGSGIWANKTLLAPSVMSYSSNSQSLGAYFDFGPALGAPKTVVVRIGISWVNVANATNNMKMQAQSISFDDAVTRVQNIWEGALETINVQYSSSDPYYEEEMKKFYSNLYHTMTSPSTFSESDGSYLGYDNLIHTWMDEEYYYTDMSIWDVHRSEFPLLALIRPNVSLAIVRSLITMAKQGGDFPRWPLANIYTACMIGNHAWVVIADNFVKGITDYDIDFAYNLMKLEATTARPYNSRVDIGNWSTIGYIPKESDDVATSLTLEYAFDDWAISQIAKGLNQTDDYQAFIKSSKNYVNVWNSKIMFMCPRLYDGTFACPPEPELHLPYPAQTGYVEGDAWQWWMFVPQDPEGLVGLFPTKGLFVNKLDQFFNLSLDWVFNNSMPNPYYWSGNEPDILAAWLFNFGGRPDLTQKWTRLMLNTQYSSKPNGIPGNDDYGTLSAWAVFAALGFYPQAGSSRYMIGSPVFDKAYIHRATYGLSDIQIIAYNTSVANIYVQNVTVNGIPRTTPFLDHSDFNSTTGVSIIEFWMTSQPTNWGKQ